MLHRLGILSMLMLGLNCFSWAQIALPAYSGGVAKSGLVLDYDFSKTVSYPGSGGVVYDLENLSAATLYNSPAFSTSPKSIVFSSASSQYLMTNTNLGTKFSGAAGSKHNNVSLLLWVNPTASNGVILSEQGINSLNANWHDSQIEMVGGVMKFRFWNIASISSSIATPLNTWYLVALTYDGRYMKAYINGQLACTVDDAGRLAPYNHANTNSLYYCLACADGTSLGSGAYGSFRLGRFRVYTTALSLRDISALYSVEKLNYLDIVFGLDAGQSTSYPGSGSTWYDLSGNGNNVSINNMTYSASIGGGSMQFTNGSNSFAQFSVPISSASTITVEMWVKASSLNNGMFFGFLLYDVWTSGGGLGFNTSAGDLFGISASQVNALGIVNNWKHLVFVMNTGSYLSNKIYVNGVSQSLTQQAGTQNTSLANFNSGLGVISGWRNDASWRYITMNLATFKIYDKELTTTEIQAKYDSEKSRYGL